MKYSPLDRIPVISAAQIANYKFKSVMSRQILRFLAAVFFSCCAISVYGDLLPDYEREARLAAEAEAGLFEGDAVYLSDGARTFLSLYTDVEDAQRAVILLHGRGFHPDWPQVAAPLREGLSENGFTTLSVQMPVLQKDAKYYDYLKIIDHSFPRIEAAIEFLKQRRYSWIAIVAHSCSVHMTMAWFSQFGDASVDAYVGIGMEATDYKQPMLKKFPLESISVPVLDLFGSADYPAVIAGASSRLEAIRAAGNDQSNQVKVEGPDHFFENYETELVDEVSLWLRMLRD